MSWFLKLLDVAGANVAKVDANGSVQVSGPATKSQAGFIGLGARVDDGTITGTPRVNRIYATEGGSLRVAPAILLWDDTFNATAQNTGKYTFTATTQTGAQAGGYLLLNNSAITTINTNSGFQTFRTFPLFARAELRCGVAAMLTQTPQANNLIEFGLFSAVLSTRVAPLDGVFWRYNAAGELRGVVNYNGTETQTAAITAPSANVNHDYLIVCQTDFVLFYIDDVLRAVITVLTDAPTLGQPMSMATQPFTARTYIGGSAPSLATQFKISDVFISILGNDINRPWSEQKAGMGHMAYQGQNGGTMGTTANTLNGATPAAAALTNTAASAGSPVGLGGLAHVLPTLAAGTDGILFSFQNPVGSVTQTPRNLVIRGVNLSGAVDLVLTGGPLVLAYSLAYGHTAISMATAEAASFASATTKAPRRVWLGVQSTIAAAVAGTALGPGPLAVRFDSPVVVAPGEFVAITVRNQGTVTSAGSIVVAAAFDAYFD